MNFLQDVFYIYLINPSTCILISFYFSESSSIFAILISHYTTLCKLFQTQLISFLLFCPLIFEFLRELGFYCSKYFCLQISFLKCRYFSFFNDLSSLILSCLIFIVHKNSSGKWSLSICSCLDSLTSLMTL